MRFKTKTLFGLLTAAAATVLAVPAWAGTLTWDSDSGGGSWTDNNWIDGSSEYEVGWTDGSDAIFGGGDVPTVTVEGNVTANSVTVNDTYVFDISEDVTLDMGSLVCDADLFIVGSGTVKMKCGSDNALSIYTKSTLSGTFTGNLEVDGWIDAANCDFNSGMTVTMVASDTGNDDPINSNEINVNSISYANAGSSPYSDTFDANLVISGAEGQAVLLRTGGSNVSIEFTGSVTSEKAELQINGGGSVTFSGDVDLAKLINYQGVLKFVANEDGTNTIHIGTLELAYDSSETTTYSTTFSTDATVDVLETAVRDSFVGADVIGLTVDNSATLTIGDIVLTRELDLTISDGASVIVTGNITASADAGKIVIGEGLLVTATGESITTEAPTSTLQGIAGSGTLSLEGATDENRFIVVTTDDFTGIVDVKKGHLRLDESSIAAGATLIVHASEGTAGSTGEYYTSGDVSLQFSEAGREFTSDINIEDSGVVFVLTNGYTGSVISGNVSVSGEGSSEGEGSSVFVQKDSEGDVTFSGTVGLGDGGYINHQGTTKFTGDVSLGKLVLAQYEAGTSSVIFSGNTATVGTLIVDTSGAAGYVKTLTVTDGAVLTVTKALALNHEVEITLDNGTLVLGDGVEVSSTGGDVKTTISISDGGQLEVGEGVTLNSATINIVLGTENMSSVSSTSVVTTYAESGVYAITGSGEIGDNVTIIITIDDAVAELLTSGEEYTFYIYDDSLGLTLNEDSINTSALEKYGVTLDGGKITLTPEPSMFGIFAGLGALALTATRRRRRRAT